ncbi:MAG TPA: carboxypeptidase-like regulatory domain-containing protein [Bacteroidales bacterium]|nr:carboxypeptidase-like regulatory domain-containing protein [Bacteroidales bacterium]HPT20996.1 carboxypeptidase-like regulatory domain-containing protein [Bacteroidales bacterium]
MKTIIRISLIAALLLTVITTQSASAGNSGTKKNYQQDYLVIKGKVVDAENGTPLVFASVAVKETNIAIITNIDGEFTLKIGESVTAQNLEITVLGYKNKTVPLSELKNNGYKNVIKLEQATVSIKEVVVRPMDPEKIVENAIHFMDKNYVQIPNLMTAFYRETIRKNRTYVSIGEAVVEVFKTPYYNDARYDATRIYKGRKSTDVEKMDTVLFKLQGGPVNNLQLDVVKNTESILTYKAMENYNYTLSGVVEIDNKPHYKISFVQKPSVEIPLFMGDFYIEMETFAITEVEFGFNLSDKEQAASIFIRKKPFGMSIYPEMVTYRTKFREQDGKWYFAYSRAEAKFKVDWKKRLFNTYYTTMSELAITDRTDKEVIKFAGKEKFKHGDVFSEKVGSFSDPKFWGDYNVIEPDQSIESVIRKLSRKLKFSEWTEN